MRDRPILADALCLAAMTLLSAAPYVADLGFYSDDWGLLASFQSAAADGRSTIAEAAASFDSRPVQGAYLALLFAIFGLDPLGYHLVNTAVIAASIPLLYGLLLRLGAGRPAAFASALLFLLLPQLSTVRVWFAAFQIPLSMLLMLVTMHAQLSFARSGRWLWLAVAIVAAALSILAYEIFAPLIAAFAAALAFVHSRVRRVDRRSWRKALAGLAVVAAVGAVVAFKFADTERVGEVGNLERYWLGALQLIRLDYDWRVDSSLNIVAALSVHFWLTLRGFATGLAALVTGELSLAVAGVAAALAALAFWRLRTGDADRPRGMTPGRLLLLGAAVFVLGHATFLIVPHIVFAPTGIGNRSLVAAAIGVAIILTAALAFAVRALPSRNRQTAFAAAVTVLAVGALARIEQITGYWAEAPGLQRQVLDATREDLRSVPAGSTVILAGVCPYHGPAVVFETSWDVGPALSLELGRALTGDAVSPRMSLTAAGLLTSIYEEPTLYPYAANLFVYDPRFNELTALPDAQSARRYFSGTRRSVRCPPGYVARGVPI